MKKKISRRYNLEQSVEIRGNQTLSNDEIIQNLMYNDL